MRKANGIGRCVNRTLHELSTCLTDPVRLKTLFLTNQGHPYPLPSISKMFLPIFQFRQSHLSFIGVVIE